MLHLLQCPGYQEVIDDVLMRRDIPASLALPDSYTTGDGYPNELVSVAVDETVPAIKEWLRQRHGVLRSCGRRSRSSIREARQRSHTPTSQ